MAQRHSAEIIAFPGPWHGARPLPAETMADEAISESVPAPAALPVETDPALRLRAALQALDAALATQRDAVAEWRGSLGALRGSVNGLGVSLQHYNASLGELGGKLATLRAQSRHHAGE